MNQNEYNPLDIEKKWQEYWQENNTYKVENNVEGKENFYALSEFAYPSGNLHVGHWYAFAVPDIYARYKRMSGYNVLYPMGFDAFGLPAENAAIKRGLDPRKWTYENMDYMRNQLKSMGASFDWDRSFATCDPEYYKWTQWMFTQFYQNDLIERSLTKTNWCESCKTVLANEQVVGGLCERCNNEVVQKDMAQWMLKITEFADELHDDLEDLNWDYSIKAAQREWIGRKEGSLIPFKIQESEVHDVNTGPGDDAFREGEPIVDRENVVVVIEHPEKDEFLCAKWKQVDWQGFVTGGIEDGMTVEETALAEVREETGYQNLEIVKVHDESSHGLFWHVVKKQNRRANYRIVHVKLTDLEQVERSEEEQAIADFLWVPRAEVNDFLKREDMKYPWRVVTGERRTYEEVKVFTTRADTLFGATYVVLAPEHDMVQNLKSQITNWDEVESYLKVVEKKSDLDRQQSKEKTGVMLKGVEAINPATGKPVSVWIADYVLAHFGTGAVMAVPAHDERDAEFAIKYDLPFKFVVLPSAGEIGSSRPLITSGENAFILAAGTIEEKGQPKINAEWNAMYDLLGTIDDGILPDGKRFCCTFEGKVINSNSPKKAEEIISVPSFRSIQKDKDWKKFKRIYAIVREKNTDNYLILKHVNGDVGLLTGGVETNENSAETAVREVLEETGYSASILRKENYKVFAEYFSKSKDVNISSLGEVFILEIDDITNIEAVSQEELEKHTAMWVKKEDIINSISMDAHKNIIKRYFNPIKKEIINVNTKTSEESQKIITEMVDGEVTKTYRLRDWGISRQRYWGTPIPMVYDLEGNPHIVPEEHLPWTLPDDVDFTPDGTAPLARSEELKKRTVEIFGEGWTPEVDTMDTFVDSSWYFYRYLDNKNNAEFASSESMKSFMPVDMYFGGAEHTTMHLLYSRFWVKALHKLGLAPADEPYKGRLNRGLILGPDGAKMSKSKGNVIDPDEVVSHVGSDTVRMYLAFIGPFNEPGNYPWDPNGVVGIKRFLERVWRLGSKIVDQTEDEIISELHTTIKKVSEDINRLKLNTAISSMMSFVNKAEKSKGISQFDYYLLIRILAPFAPHMCEELWMQNHDISIHHSEFPQYDESKISSGMKALPIQINGKVRAQVVVEEGENNESLQSRILEIPDVQKWTDAKEVKKFIHIPGKIINLVVV